MTHVAVLPTDLLASFVSQLDNITTAQRFLRLPHPRTGLPSLYLLASLSSSSSCQIVEVQSVSPHSRRSWFLGDTEVVKDGSMVMMTPVDAAFIVLPILQAAFPSGTPGNLRTLDDIFEASAAKLLENLTSVEVEGDVFSERDIHSLSLLPCIQDAMKRVCEHKDVTSDISVFRFSSQKYLDYLEKKARRIAESDAIAQSDSLVRGLARHELMDDGKEELLRAGRLKLACELISQYIPSELHKELLSRFDFTALDNHVQNLQKADLVLTALDGTNESSGKKSKSAKPIDEEGTGKKRKAATQGSKGVEKLKKVNTNGMAKLSSFFQKQGSKA